MFRSPFDTCIFLARRDFSRSASQGAGSLTRRFHDRSETPVRPSSARFLLLLSWLCLRWARARDQGNVLWRCAPPSRPTLSASRSHAAVRGSYLKRCGSTRRKRRHEGLSLPGNLDPEVGDRHAEGPGYMPLASGGGGREAAQLLGSVELAVATLLPPPPDGASTIVAGHRRPTIRVHRDRQTRRQHLPS